MKNNVIENNKRTIIDAFNNIPKNGIDLIKKLCQENNLNVEQEIANLFYREKNNLDLEAVGDYLSGLEEEQQKTLGYFNQQFDFKGQPFIQGLRNYLKTFKLPGEAQKIYRMIEAFAGRYYQQNQDGVIKHQDAAFLLAYQTILLNTDLHNPSIKEEQKMTFDQLKRQLRDCNTSDELQTSGKGEDFDSEFLKQIYDEIKAVPFEFNFIKFAPGYELNDQQLKNDQTFQALNNILSTAFSPVGKDSSTNKIYKLPTEVESKKSSINDIFPKLQDNIVLAEVSAPKSWLNIFTGYQGTVTVQDEKGIEATIQLYIPGIMSEWFLGDKPKIIVQPVCDNIKQPTIEAVNMAANITASFTVPITNIKATFDYLKADLNQAYAIARATETAVSNSIDYPQTIKRSISNDSGIGDELDDTKASTIQSSNILSQKHNMIYEASINLTNQFFKNDKIINEAILVDRIFDDKILSKEAKQQLLNNLLDNNHIRENKSLTKDELTKMFMDTQFIQEHLDNLIKITIDNQSKEQNKVVKPVMSTSPISETQISEIKSEQNEILKDSPTSQILPHELKNLDTNTQRDNLQVKSLITLIRKDFNNMQGYIAQELIKIIAAADGKIESTNHIKITIDPLLNADPKSDKNQGRAVLSLLQTEQEANEKIEALINKGADPKDFEALKIEMLDIRTNLENKLSSTENIQKLVTARLKQQALSELPFMKGDGSIMMTPQETTAIVTMLEPYVSVPNNIYSLLNSKDTQFVKTTIAPYVHKRMAEFFSVEGNNDKHWCTLNPEKLSFTNLEACGKALSSDFAKLLLTKSENITINISDLENHIMTTPTANSPDPITNLIELSLQAHVQGLKSLYDCLQSDSSITLDQLKEQYSKGLLSDLEQFTKLETSKSKKLPIFKEEFYDQILKAPVERSKEYNDFINKYAELPNTTFIVAKNSARTLLAFDKDGQILKNFKDNLFSKMQEFKDSQVEQADKDYNRMAILYKDSDCTVRQISLQELKESPYIALSNEQRDFIATSWHQGTFESGWAMQYFVHKAIQQEVMPPTIDGGRTSILIDVSDGVKVHNRIFIKSMNPDDPIEKIPHAEMALSVDISDMKGDKFMPGCSTKPRIEVNMQFLDKKAALNLPEELINIMKFSNIPVAIDTIKQDSIKGYVQMICSQYIDNIHNFNNDSFYRGWNNLSKQIGPDKAFFYLVKEVFAWQKNASQKEQIINKIIDKIVEPSDDKDFSIEPQQAVQMFCDAESDIIAREKFASKCLDLFFQQQQTSVLDPTAAKYIEESVISVLLPLCRSAKEQKRVKQNTSKMVRQCIVQSGKELSWMKAWKRFKDEISVVAHLMGKQDKVAKLMSQYPNVTKTLAKNLSNTAVQSPVDKKKQCGPRRKTQSLELGE